MKRSIWPVLAAWFLVLSSQSQASELADLKVLDLFTAQRIALSQNPSLAAAAERVEQARQRIYQARALYYPTLDLDGGAGRGWLSESAQLNQQGGEISIDRDQSQYQFSLSANWVLFDGFSRKFSNMIAEYGSSESEQARRDGQRILLESVAQAYYNAHLELYGIDIARADIEFNQQQLEEAQIRYEQGAGSLSNVLNFKVQINRARTTLLTTERDYETSRYSLAVLLGKPDGQLPTALELAQLEMLDQADFKNHAADQLLAAAERYRPDLVQQQLRIERSQAEIGKARAPYYPSLGLAGSIDGERSEDIYLDEDDFGSSIGLRLTYNLYRGGADKARVRESEAARREALRNYEQLKNQVTGEVRQAWANVRLAQQQLVLQRYTTDLVTQTRDLVSEGYNAGQESLVRLNEAQRDLVRTQSNLALALVGLYSTRYRLASVTGESLLEFYPDEVR